MKYAKRIAAAALVVAIVFGSSMTSLAANSMDASSEQANAGYDVTATSERQISANLANPQNENDARIAVVARQVVNGQKVTYTDSASVSCLVQLGYACNGNGGPFSITKGSLTYKNLWWTETKDVYVVAISGTDTSVAGQSTGVWTDLLSGFEFDNQYVRNVKKAIQQNVPAGSNLIVTGHSLGGMVGQQIAADSDIKKNYNVLNTVAFGSPLIDGFDREGMVKRLGDTSDVVPYLSVSTFINIIWQSAGINKENGKYGLNLLGAHTESYNRQDVWGAYDPCGEKNGSRKLTLDYKTTHFYASPTKVTE